jgi:hypothetical protein
MYELASCLPKRESREEKHQANFERKNEAQRRTMESFMDIHNCILVNHRTNISSICLESMDFGYRVAQSFFINDFVWCLNLFFATPSLILLAFIIF